MKITGIKRILSQKLLKYTFFSIIFLGSITPSYAQKIEITPTAGWMFAGVLNTYQGQLNIRNNWNYGLLVDINIQKYMAVELMYTRLNTNVDLIKSGLTTALWPNFVEEYWQIGVMRTVKKIKNISVFAGGTLGATYFNPNDSEYGDDWRFSITLGGGVKYYISDRIGLRFDARLMMPIYWGSGSFYIGGGSGGFAIGTGTVIPQIMLNGGLIIIL